MFLWNWFLVYVLNYLNKLLKFRISEKPNFKLYFTKLAHFKKKFHIVLKMWF